MVYPVMATSLLKVGFHILLPFILFSFHIRHAMSTNFYINSRCSVTANYTDGSAFEVNMLSLFSTLTNDALPTGFSNATVGEGSETVYGLVQCRGDVGEQDCKVCIYNSTVQVVKYCPNTMDAIIWYENCELRYSNTNFFGRLNTADSGNWYWDNDKVTDIKGFNEKLGILLKNLTSLATTTTAALKLMFATGNIPYTGLQTIYGLVECTRDTSLADCKQCLDTTRSWIPSTCGTAHGCEIATGSCRVRFDTVPFYGASVTALSPNSSPNPSPPNSSPPSNGQRNRERKLMFVIVLVSVLIAVLITCVLCVFYWWRRQKLKPNGLQRNEEEEAALQQQGYGGEEIDSKISLVFDLDIIRAATNNFSDANKLGEGGYGPVYKGQLSDGQQVAVKRLSRNSGQGSTEFKNEVKLVAKLQHRNLVRLLGCCFEGEEKILVYEYVPNRSLDKLLFDPVRKMHLDWQIRSKIIAGVARGLLYLHEDSRLKIIHRDLKASNILLDQDMTAKISDFGMAKLVGVEETQGKTSKVAGTYGYMAPEYVMQGQFSVKSDVFSFGVLMLETVSGLKNSSFPHSQYGPSLLDYAWRLWRERRATELLDASLTHSTDESEVVRCIHIGLLCAQEDATRRPTMSSVVLMLSSSSLTLPAPSAPAFVFGRGRLYSETSIAGSSAASTESDTSRSGSVPKSITEMTMSEIGAR